MKQIFKRSSMALLRNFMLGLIALSGSFYSCNSDDISDDAYYTFVGETVATYCKNNAEFSIFNKIMEESGNFSLLSCYGHFTCFAPTDSAFNVYFKEKNISYDDLTKEDKQTIVYNHIIKSDITEYLTKDFQEGALPTPNMSDRFLVISYAGYEQGRQIILVNKDAPILEKDIKLHNGAIHVVGKVVEPSANYLSLVLKQNDYFSLFSQAFDMTHLGDSIEGIYDYSYKSPYDGDYIYYGTTKLRVLRTKKYGYTVFAETNEALKNAGIQTIDQLIQFANKYYGNEDPNDYTSRKNALNKFISYHMLNRQMSTGSLLYSGPCTSPNAEDKKYEYYETMLQNRLIEIKSGNKINTLKNGTFVGLDDFRSNHSGVNGYVHALTNVLVYDETKMQQDVLNKRIRFDVYSVAPQLTNNNIRWKLVDNETYSITPDFCDEYIIFNDACRVTMWASNYWTNNQADEILISVWYDFKLRMLPVPPGSYEIRLGYRAEDWRGIAQLFIDDQISGIPVDLSIRGTNPSVGWVSDESTNDNGAENDKMMRNRGYMKAPNSIYSLNGPKNLRQDNMSLRIIIGTFTFQDYAPHYFRAKNVELEDRQLHLDYIEYVPISFIDSEGVD